MNYELLHLLNKHSPLLIKKPYKNKKDKWFDLKLTNLLKHCRKTERKWRKTQSVIHKAEYKYFQKLYRQTIQKKRQEFHSNSITQANSNLRMLFSKICKLLGDKPNILPDENDNFICATKFQHFFKDKIIKIRKNIDEERKELTKENKCEPCSSCMYTGEPMTVFKTLETDDLKILFKSINYKFSILDRIPTWLLLECFNELAPIVLLSIINNFLSTGIFPSTLKQSVVIPIIKNFHSDPNELLNYRPYF